MSDSTTTTTPWSVRTDKHLAWIARLWQIFYLGLGMVVLSVAIFSFMTPGFKVLEDPSLRVASEVVAGDDSTVLGRFFIENRAPVTYDRIPKHLINALVATEDARFFSHSGIDPEALGRVVFKTILLAQKGQGGGSTISMQLAKLLHSDRDFKDMNFFEKALGYYSRKFIEMITAIKLERAYTKEEILTMYLNTYDFGYNAHGIRAASEIYFNKIPEKLTLDEAATLVGMCNNSSLFNPRKRADKATARRNKVLERTFSQGYIDEKAFRLAKSKKVDVSNTFNPRSHNEGLATYFRMTLADDVKRIIKEKELINPKTGELYDVYRDGLKIYTTIDADMQRMAEEAMKEHMSVLQSKYFRVWKGRDPWTYKDAETTDDMIKLRNASLNARIRESERFQLLKAAILGDLMDEVEASFSGFNLMDSDVINMLKEDTKKGFIDAMLKTNSLSSSRASTYRSIMRSEIWPRLKRQWLELEKKAKEDFNRPTSMRIFAYTPTGEKDTVMTPLDSVRYLRMHLQIGSMGVDPTNGFVRFWVGGVGHKYFQYDHVKSDRQVGSTFKPFVYATAILNGMSPCRTVRDVPQTIAVGEGSFGLSAPWTPRNSGGYSGASLNLFEALKESKNTASVALLKELGSTQPVREIVSNMGIDVDAQYSSGQLRVPKNPAICLGAADLQVFEMTGAFAAFANEGFFIEPMYIRKITDKSGRLLYQGAIERRQGQALPKNVAEVMTRMLRYNVKAAAGINSLKSEVGGKTGTTNNYRDGWFIGVAPRLAVGTWVGGEDQWIRFLSINEGQGSAMARPFFAKFMAKLEKSKVPTVVYDPNAKFKEYQGQDKIVTDCGLYQESGAMGLPEEVSPSEFNRFQDEESEAIRTQGSNVPAGGNKPVPPKTNNKPVKPRSPDDDF